MNNRHALGFKDGKSLQGEVFLFQSPVVIPQKAMFALEIRKKA